jgi:Skp family chaperone for outer membrane proteins
MTKRILTTATLILLTSLLLPALHARAQEPGKPGRKIQVATVSISRIVDSYERTKELNGSLAEKEEELEADLKKIEAALKSAVEEFKTFKTRLEDMQKKGAIPKDEASLKKLQEEELALLLPIRQQELLLARKTRQVDRDLVEAKRNSQIIIVRDILGYVRAKIALTDYDVVINMDEALTSDTRIDGGFMFARHRTDITDMIIEGLNKQYRALPK